MTDRTLVLCKPDAVERKLVGEIIRRIEAKNLSIVALELRELEVDVAQVHYEEHDGKPFFSDLVEFITRSPLVAMVVEGPDAQPVVRTLMGATNPRRRGAGHDPGRSRDRAHREPDPRLRFARIRSSGDRALLSRARLSTL